MPRLRQAYNDCAVVVFCYITGEDENTGRVRFIPRLTGEAGVSLSALSCCLLDAGWRLTPLNAALQQVGPDGFFSEAVLKAFWTDFQGEAVVHYTKDNAKIGHIVLVRSGGVVLDPSPLSPEDGEFIVDHFNRVGGKIGIMSVSKVTRMLP